MNNFLIFANANRDVNLSLSNKIIEYLNKHGAGGVIVTDMEENYENNLIKEELLTGIDAVIVLGGDGTMLRAAHCMGDHAIPHIGINLGTLGFLNEIDKSKVYEALDRLMADDFNIEERMMIEGHVGGNTFHSLNDIVVTRAGFSRIIGLSIYVNDQLLDTYEADGVIVATPTGSTGYNLSAGGPIVSPRSKLIIVTPISPHSLTTKSVVFDGGDKIRIEIVRRGKTQTTEAIASFDGDNNTELRVGDTIDVNISDRTIKLIKMHDVNFYRVLREKIGGSLS